MKKTKREQLIDGLRLAGWRESTQQNSSRYVTFIHDSIAGPLYVGKKGALRAGKSASSSRSMEGTPAYENFIKAGA